MAARGPPITISDDIDRVCGEERFYRGGGSKGVGGRREEGGSGRKGKTVLQTALISTLTRTTLECDETHSPPPPRLKRLSNWRLDNFTYLEPDDVIVAAAGGRTTGVECPPTVV